MFNKDKKDENAGSGGASQNDDPKVEDLKDDNSEPKQKTKMKKVTSYIFYSSPAQKVVLQGGFRNPTTGQYTAPVSVMFANGQVVLNKEDPKVEMLLNDSRCKKYEGDSGSFWYGGKIIDTVKVPEKKEELWSGPPPAMPGPGKRAHVGAITTHRSVVKG